MAHYNVVIGFFSIVIGLLITKLFSGVHGLIKSKGGVVFHWLPLLVVWYVFMMIIRIWWSFTAHYSQIYWDKVGVFVIYCHLLFMLYLIVANLLPDPLSDDFVDLIEHYFSKNRYFWGLMTAVTVLAAVTYSIRESLIGDFENRLFVSVNMVCGLLMVSMALTKKVWIHGLAVVSLFAIMICELAGVV